jgi:uncharacterized protein (TIGR02271 family)
MPLRKIKDFDPNYRDHFENKDIQGFDLYSGNEKIGFVDHILVDDDGNFRYLVINTGVWVLGKQVLLPIGRSRIDYNDGRVYVDGLSRAQVESLPAYNENMAVDYDHEEQVRRVYRPTVSTSGNTTPLASNATYDRNTYSYNQDPSLYNLTEREHQTLKLYEERIVANKKRVKTGEVTVGKHIETETAQVSVPVEKERVVVERITPVQVETTIAPSDDVFREREVARVDVYEEMPDIRKQAFVREEVRINKVVEQDTVNVEQQIRREELDINRQGRSVVEPRPDIESARTNYAAATPISGNADRVVTQYKRAVGIFSSRQEAEDALLELKDAGFPMAQVSVVAKDADRNDQLAGADMSDQVGNKADTGAATGAVTGGVLGGVTGLLIGLGALAIPGIGPVMLAGATATAIATTLSGGAIGAAAGGLVGAIVGLGIPEEQARVYDQRITHGHYLVILDGTEDEIHRAGALLNNRGIQEWRVYAAPAAAPASTEDVTAEPGVRRRFP